MSFWKNSHPPTVSHGHGSGGGGGPFPVGNLAMHGQQQQQQQQHHYPSTLPSHPTTATLIGNTTIETNGPRAKCDQVVFEAIAKAAEIIVGSRCWIDPTNVAVQQHQQQQQHFYNNGNGTSTIASSSRFNLFVLEVQGVR
jgi:hypothetical protein